MSQQELDIIAKGRELSEQVINQYAKKAYYSYGIGSLNILKQHYMSKIERMLKVSIDNKLSTIKNPYLLCFATLYPFVNYIAEHNETTPLKNEFINELKSAWKNVNRTNSKLCDAISNKQDKEIETILSMIDEDAKPFSQHDFIECKSLPSRSEFSSVILPYLNECNWSTFFTSWILKLINCQHCNTVQYMLISKKILIIETFIDKNNKDNKEPAVLEDDLQKSIKCEACYDCSKCKNVTTVAGFPMCMAPMLILKINVTQYSNHKATKMASSFYSKTDGFFTINIDMNNMQLQNSVYYQEYKYTLMALIKEKKKDIITQYYNRATDKWIQCHGYKHEHEIIEKKKVVLDCDTKYLFYLKSNYLENPWAQQVLSLSYYQ